MQAFVENLARLAGAASRHRAADVALVRDRAAEAEQRAVDEHRRDHRDVRRVRAAALIGMIDQEGVALRDGAAELREHGGAAGRKRADMQRQHHMLRDHLACAFISAQEASCDSRTMVEKPVRNSEFCISWTMPDRLALTTSRSTASIAVHSRTLSRWHHPRSRSDSSTRSTRATWPAQITVVQSN